MSRRLEPLALLAAGVFALTAFSQLEPPIGYLVLLGVYLVLLAASLSRWRAMSPRGYSALIASIIVFAMTLRLIYMARTGFIVEPLYDGYKTLVTSWLFSEAGRIYVVEKPFELNYASSFPGLQAVTLITGYFTGLDTLRAALFVSTVVGFSIILVVLLFLKRFSGILGLGAVFVGLGLAITAVWPETVYYGMVYYSRHYSLALYYLLMYSLLFSDRRKIILILSLAFPFSYSLFPVMTVILLASTAIAMLLLRSPVSWRIVSGTLRLGRIEPGYLDSRAKLLASASLLLFISGSMVALYYVSGSILVSSRRVLEKIATFWLNLQEPVVTKQLLAPYWIPPVLRCDCNILVTVRDVLLYLPALAGLLILFYQKRKDPVFNQFKTDIVVFMAGYLLLHLVFVEGGKLASQTTLHMVNYLLIPFTAIAYYFALRRLVGKKQNRFLRLTARGIVVILLFIALLAGGLGLWSHRVLLRHYYDTGIGFVEAGDHNTAYNYVSSFTTQYLERGVLGHLGTICVDDGVLGEWMFREQVVRGIRVEQLAKILLEERPGSSISCLLVVLNNGYLLMKPYGWKTLDLTDLLEQKNMYLASAEKNANRIYSIGRYAYVLFPNK